MRLLFLLLCCAIGAGARAQCLSLQDMRSLLGRTLADEDPFMTGRGFPYSDVASYRSGWGGQDNGLTRVLTYSSAGNRVIDRVDYYPDKPNRCLRTLLNQLHHTAGLVADGEMTIKNPLKRQLQCYKAPDCGVIVSRNHDGQRAVCVYTLAQYVVAKELLSKLQ